LKVIASAGSDAKVEYLKSELGVDIPFNYKTTSTAEVLKRNGPINIYWDNVGAETLDAAIDACTLRSRIIMCGYISEYNNAGEKYGVKNLDQMFHKRIIMKGFLAPDHMEAFMGRFFTEIPPLVAQGKIKSNEVIIRGLENAEEAFVRMFHGDNIGKMVVLVADSQV